jgi:putative ABC transport system permease protein
MSVIREAAAIVTMNTRAMRMRVAASLVVVVSMAAFVGVTLSIFSLSAGMSELIRQTSPTPDRMAVVSEGAIDGGPSNISREALAIIEATPGIKKDPDGRPMISGTVSTIYLTNKKSNGVEIYIGVTGVAPNILYRRPEVKIVEGRLFTPGLREFIAGKGAVSRFKNIELGKEVLLADGPWKIVGIFEGAGTSDYNIWTDSDTLANIIRRTSYSSIFVRLEEGTPEAQAAFKAALKSNPALSVDVETELQNRQRSSRNITEFYALLAYGVGAIMGLGAIVASLNTMYAAVSARTVEIATLRALGFSSMPVVISLVVEAVLLTFAGAMIGALMAWGVFNGREQNYGSLMIPQTFTAEMLAVAFGAALLVALIGALFPAIRAARLPVSVALMAR